MGHEGSSLASLLLAAHVRRKALATGQWIEADTEEPCAVCEVPTKFREVGFEAPMCPGRCTSLVETQFWADQAREVRAERAARLGR